MFALLEEKKDASPSKCPINNSHTMIDFPYGYILDQTIAI